MVFPVHVAIAYNDIFDTPRADWSYALVIGVIAGANMLGYFACHWTLARTSCAMYLALSDTYQVLNS